MIKQRKTKVYNCRLILNKRKYSIKSVQSSLKSYPMCCNPVTKVSSYVL